MFRKIRFNVRQKRAIAQHLGSVGAGVVLALIVAVFVDAKLTLINAIVMGVFALFCFIGAVWLLRD